MSNAVSQDLILNQVRLTVNETVATAAQRQQWQRRLNHALSRVSLYSDLPPQAILVVRQLPDPQPGSLLADNLWRGLHDWEQAAQTALSDCWRTAVRPVRSPVPPTANSVWFADPAEWLACLSWDLHRGVAGDRWWWQTALRSHTHRSRSETLFQLWREQTQWLPAALTLMVRHHQTETAAFLSELTPAQAQQLLEQVTQVYQCFLPHPPLAAPELALPALTTALQPHLAASVRRLTQPLHLETQALVAVCLTLPNTTQLLKATLTEFPTADCPASETPTQETPAQTQHIQGTPNIPKPSAFESATPPTATAPRSSVPNIPNIVAIASTPLDSMPGSEANLARQNGESPTYQIAQPQLPEPYPEAAPDIFIDSVDSTPPDAPFLATPDFNLGAEQGIATAVGGLWYLVNVLAALDWLGQVSLGAALPGSVSTSISTSMPMSTPALTPWQQLLALAQALLPDIPPDPVWELLAAIAGDPVPAPLLAQWQAETLGWVQPYLAERLEQPDVMGDYLLAPATLYLTRTHVDVVFTLDQIRLDVRLAGLDRDPGWVPKLARAIAFHYE